MSAELCTILINRFRADYKRANRTDKSKLLDMLEQTTQKDRKYLIRLLRSADKATVAPRAGRPAVYGEELAAHLLELNRLMEGICAKRMKQAIPLWINSYDKHVGGLEIKVRNQLLKISASSIGRLLKKARRGVGISSTKPNQRLKPLIPLKRLDEKVTKPGTVQADTVAHCGSALLGNFINTLTMTDVFTGWTENRACWTKESKQIKSAIIDIEKQMPIIMNNFDTDCGTEFLNYRIMRHFENRDKKVQMRRSRPYKKNDQCYVEQKNSTHVRALFGYDRLEHESLVRQMNKIYREYWNPLNNYFLPSYKLEEKVRIGARIKKTYDLPKTPAQRLLNAKSYSGYMKRRVDAEFNKLDPIKLKLGLEKELKKFYQLLEYENIKQAG